MINERTLKPGLTTNQCLAARYLHADGWTYKELQQVFEVTSDALARHINNNCDHPGILTPPIKIELGPRDIKQARHKAGLTQAELATEIGVTRNTVSGWETGRLQPNAKHTRKIRILLINNAK